MFNLQVGRMIHLSKSQYRSEHPNNVIVFNANVCTKSRGKLWHGDLDLTLDKDVLKMLAQSEGETVYVLREMDAYEQGQPEKINFDLAVEKFENE